MKMISLPSGEVVPMLGQGTWYMGEDQRRRAEEAAALKLGLDLGMTLIDTAEMYASGGAEEVVREAVAGRRDEVFIVSKVLPSNASLRGTQAACDRSLKRLGTDRIDLYLLHWRGVVPLSETVAAFDALKAAGKIRHWGVSNFDVDDMEELDAGSEAQADQVLYNLTRRGVEFDLLPWLKERSIPAMAYSPIEQGILQDDRRLAGITARHGATAAQIALAFAMRSGNVIAIPKAVQAEHVRANRAALDIKLSNEDLAELDAAFPPPARKQSLEMI